MSDYEDEMDVDGPSAKDDITFSSANTDAKGKRSAANLPVEAEDSLPWYVTNGYERIKLTIVGSRNTDLIL